MTSAARSEWNDGYDAGLEAVEGAIPPSTADDPYAAGWHAGVDDRAHFASAAADRSDAEIAEGMAERSEHPAWAVRRVEEGLDRDQAAKVW